MGFIVIAVIIVFIALVWVLFGIHPRKSPTVTPVVPSQTNSTLPKAIQGSYYSLTIELDQIRHAVFMAETLSPVGILMKFIINTHGIMYNGHLLRSDPTQPRSPVMIENIILHVNRTDPTKEPVLEAQFMFSRHAASHGVTPLTHMRLVPRLSHEPNNPIAPYTLDAIDVQILEGDDK